ncbi:MAG: DUF995 domain-containing protein [Ruegeria sp.]
MSHLTKLSLIAVISIATTTVGIADPRPQGAKKAPPQEVANFYAGKTQSWSSCNGGGIYYGGGWQAQAYCKEDGESVGIGTWSISRNGRICHDLTWYWRDEDGSVKSSDKPVSDRNCDDIVMASDGTLWARWVHKKTEADAWWNLNRSESIRQGNKLKGKINRMRRNLGV